MSLEGNGYDLAIRSVLPQDLARTAALLSTCFELVPSGMTWALPIVRRGIQEDLKYRLKANQPYYACFVAEICCRETREVQLVGTAEVSLRSPAWSYFQRSRYPYLANLAVSPKYRHQGIAQKLLACCERTVVQWGMQDLYLHVLADNASARRLYLAAGYGIHRIEQSWSSWLVTQSPRLFLHKPVVEIRH